MLEGFRHLFAARPLLQVLIDVLDIAIVAYLVYRALLVVRGTRSDMFAAETAEKVVKTNAGLSLVEVDAGHDVGGDVPDELVAHIKSFLA